MTQITLIRKYFLIVTVVVLAAFLLLIVASWLWMATLDLQSQRARFETLASQTLSRTVRIDGALHLRAALFPRVAIENIHIANPKWASQPDFLSIKRLEIEISPLTLWHRALVIQEIELIGVTVHLQRGRNRDATWDFIFNTTQESSSAALPDIVALHVTDLLIVYDAPDQAPVNIAIDELQTSLMQNEAVEMQINGKVHNFPLSLTLQGGTLAELMDPQTRWPITGSLDTDTASLAFEGYITDPTTLNGLELKIVSDKLKLHDLLFLGRRVKPLLDRYQLNLSVSKEAGTFAAKLSGEFYGFDSSRLQAQSSLQKNASVTFQELKINARASGRSWHSFVQSIAIDATGSGIEYPLPGHDATKKPSRVRLDRVNIKSIANHEMEFTAQGKSNGVALQWHAIFNDALNALWKNQDVPFDTDIQTDTANAHVAGRIIKPLSALSLEGTVSINADDLATLGVLIGQTWPASAAVNATSSVKLDNKTLALSDVRAQLGSQQIVGDVTLGFNKAIDLSLHAHADRFNIHDVMPEELKPENRAMDMQDINLSFQGKLQKKPTDAALAGDLKVDGKIHTQAGREQTVDLQGRLAMAHGDVKLTDAVAKTDGVVVKGELLYDSAQSPALAFNVTDGSIDLAHYPGEQMNEKTGEKTKPDLKAVKKNQHGDRIIPELAFDFEKLSSLNFAILIKALNITYNDTAIVVLNGQMTASKGVIRVDTLQAHSNIDGLNVTSRFEIDSTTQPGKASFELEAQKINFGEIFKRLHVTDQITGTLDLKVHLDGQGQSLREVMGSANGVVQLVADKGSIPKWALDIWGADLVQFIFPVTWLEDPLTDLTCAVGRFDVEDGMMRSRTLLADTKRVTVAGNIVINWKDEQVSGLFKPQPKKATLFHFGTPIKISGALAHPRFGSVESGITTLGKLAISMSMPITTIVMFGDVGAKEKNPCAALLNESTP